MPNSKSTSFGTVSVIDTTTNNVTATLNVGNCPNVVAAAPDGTNVYVAYFFIKNISVIGTINSTVIIMVNIGNYHVSAGILQGNRATVQEYSVQSYRTLE